MTKITIYMFRHQGITLRASFRSKDYKYNTPLQTTHFTLHTSHASSGRDLFPSQRSRKMFVYEGWNFNSGNYLFTTDTK